MTNAAIACSASLFLLLLPACFEPVVASDDQHDASQHEPVTGTGGTSAEDASVSMPSADDASVSMPSIMDVIAAGGDCPKQNGAGTMHDQDITSDETWSAAGSPHAIIRNITVKGTLTVEACAKVVLAKGVSVDIGSSSDAGKLITRGEYKEATNSDPEVVRPVTFSSAAEDEYWGMLFVNGLGHAEFNNTVLIRGGDASAVSTSRGGSLVARGANDGTLRRMITANMLLVLESGSFGITLESGAGFEESDSAAVVVQGTGRLPRPSGYGASFDPVYPVFVEPPGVGSLPLGIYYGSTEDTLQPNDRILVVPRNAVAIDEQFHERGVPYLITDTSFYMRPDTTATLTIDPGVVLAFHHDPQSSSRIGMILGDGASIDPRPVTIDIQGTADNPVVFTSNSETPAAGDWMGLNLDASPSSGNHFTYASVLYAGGNSGTNSYGCGPKSNDSAILITDWRPDDAFIENVEIGASAGGGIVCGWASDADGPDLKAGNTFSEIANGCDVSRWQNATGLACPDRTEAAPLCL